ncbi:hypothetical protein SAMN06265795_103269 [Noviherbaspirillum humi]|uniref:Uncharacterized protein n=1 Tax=Noviherbaspirillum humi TaxID=1688639 RepID=A0A239FCQ1_9BURK|nr:hypothetical protein SAMN06265795_103269 [Noviherbaspirillum humi]
MSLQRYDEEVVIAVASYFHLTVWIVQIKAAFARGFVQENTP